MYIPPAFGVSNSAQLFEFIEQHSFGILTSNLNGVPFASHLPFLLDRDQGSQGTLLGHMARPNPQWTQLDDQECLIIFSGPHAYISPTWYESENVVPTWNYVAVHAYGTAKLIEDPQKLYSIVADSVKTYERTLPNPWSLGSRDTFIDRLLLQIVGFEIQIQRLEGKWKLNQNHPLERQQKVAAALINQGGPNSTAVAALMQKQIASSSPQ
jgi:transcriptional regulator